ncbi:cation transporter [Candidatus Gracilibacteria bacterium]|nr:cation transporter [Candidatus Gracilibacteria bacterium]
MNESSANSMVLTRYAWLAIGTAVVTIGLKAAAYFVTGSIGLLSDAIESLVNLAAAIMELIVLSVAARPPDEDHEYGHSKAEYFSSGAEGALILIAAYSIISSSIGRFAQPQPVEAAALGLVLSSVASGINLVVAQILLRASRRFHSPTLHAGGQHLMTDVWTSVGVIIGVAAVAISGWQQLDALIAIAVAVGILFSGVRIVRSSLMGLLDTALPATEREQLNAVLKKYQQQQPIEFHALRTRQAGARRFVSVHILVPGAWTVQRGHHLLEAIEHDIRTTLPQTTVFTHLEPIEDPASWQDQELDRRSVAKT